MRIVIAGGHGKIALILERLLAEAGHEPVAIIRNPDHRADVDATGAAAVVLDLEAASVDEVAQVLKNADVPRVLLRYFVKALGSGFGKVIDELRRESVSSLHESGMNSSSRAAIG